MTKPVPSVQLALKTKPTEAPQWLDVTPWVKGFSVRRGRQHPLEPAGPGTATLTLDNRDRRFDPTYTAGPYYGLLKSTRRGRIRAVQDGRAADYIEVIRADSPVVYYRKGEASGTTATDSSGNGRDGTYSSTPLAAQFTAANSEYLSRASNSTLQADSTDYTIAFWFYADTDVEGQLFTKDTDTSREYTVDRTPGGNYRFYINGGGGANLVQKTLASTGTWIFVLASFTASTRLLSIDLNNSGAPVTSTGTVATPVGAAEFRIGARQYPGFEGYTNGRIDAAAFWKRLLTSDEKASIYNSGNGVSYSDLTDSLKTSLISWWDLDEASGTRNDAHGTNHLTDNNTVTQATGKTGRRPTLGQTGALTGDSDTAALFDGSSGYVQAPASALTAITGTDFTVETWIYPTAWTGAYTAVFDTPGRRISLFLNAGGSPSPSTAYIAVKQVGGGTEINLSQPFTLDEWQKVTLKRSGSTIYLYRNAVEVGTTPFAGNDAVAYDEAVHFAGNPSGGGFAFTGKQDEAAIYNAALSAARISAHYEAGTTARGTVHDLMHFYVDDWPLRRENYGNQYVEVTGSDALKVWNLPKISATYPEQRTDERIAAVLTDLNWTTGQAWMLGDATYGILGSTTFLAPVGDRALDQGATSVQVSTLARTQALGHLQAVERTEFGFLFVAKNGAATFHNRDRRLLAGSTGSLATFGDDLDAGELPYAAIEPAYDEAELWNDISVTREGGAAQTAEDVDSQLDHFPRSLDWSTLGISDSESAIVAGYLRNRYSRQRLRITALTLDPKYPSGTIWRQLLTRELGDVITVRNTPLGGGNRIEQVSFIEGMALDWIAEGNNWGTPQWSLSPADTTRYWRLGVSTLGVDTYLAI